MANQRAADTLCLRLVKIRRGECRGENFSKHWNRRGRILDFFQPLEKRLADIDEHASAEVADNELVGIERVVGDLRRQFHMAAGAVAVLNLNDREVTFIFEEAVILTEQRRIDC